MKFRWTRRWKGWEDAQVGAMQLHIYNCPQIREAAAFIHASRVDDRSLTRRACEAEARQLLEDMYWACRQACLDWGIDVDAEEEPERGT